MGAPVSLSPIGGMGSKSDVTLEQLAAYVDGELEGAEAARMLLAVASSPHLMRVVQRQRLLRERMDAEFGPILNQGVPERFVALLYDPAERGERPLRREQLARVRSPRTFQRPVTAAKSGRPISASRGWLVVTILAAALVVAMVAPAGFSS